MTNIKLEHWDRAVNNALRGMRTLKRLKRLINDDVQYKNDFTQLKEKLEYRMLEARKH